MVKVTPVIQAALARKARNLANFREDWQEFKQYVNSAYEEQDRPQGYAYDQELDQEYKSLEIRHWIGEHPYARYRGQFYWKC